MTLTPTAPSDIRYCSRCGAKLELQMIEAKPRPVCTGCGFIHFLDPKVAVGILLVVDGEILLVRRTMNPEKGKWSLPAGYVDKGENPQATAVRETWEETGLNVAIEKLLGVYHNPPEQGGADIFILYQVQLLGGTLEAADDADAAGFFNLTNLPELAFASTQAAIAFLAQA